MQFHLVTQTNLVSRQNAKILWPPQGGFKGESATEELWRYYLGKNDGTLRHAVMTPTACLTCVIFQFMGLFLLARKQSGDVIFYGLSQKKIPLWHSFPVSLLCCIQILVKHFYGMLEHFLETRYRTTEPIWQVFRITWLKHAQIQNCWSPWIAHEQN